MDRASARHPWRRRGAHLRRCGLAAAALACALPAAAVPPDDLGGTYRMQGSARVDAAAPLGRNIDARGDAVVRVEPGRVVVLRLSSMGQACEVTAIRADDGALSFDPGQRCLFDVRDPDARGHVAARLRTGRGRLRDRHLALDLAFDLSGSIALRAAAAVNLLGVQLPASWTPDLRLDGPANVRVEGDRDESRAAAP